jgi:signal recognition particle receptor subunit beta
MALINHRAREIHFKVVYYGPGLCGKTTNLKYLYEKLPPERRGRLISISTDHERTLFFDFLPIDLGQIQGMTTRFHLYTVPGQVYYQRSRRAVLQGLDAVVFVADSHPAREIANRESLADLHANLTTLGVTPEEAKRLGWVFQYNKRDLPAVLPVERLRAALNPAGHPEFEAVASQGRGVNETLKSACKAMLSRLAAHGPAMAHAHAPGSAATPAAHTAPTIVPAAPWTTRAPRT